MSVFRQIIHPVFSFVLIRKNKKNGRREWKIMKILILNGSPRAKGNTAAMVAAFQKWAEEAGNKVTVVPVAKKKIAGCIGFEYCHTKGDGKCVQKDDMQEIYPMMKEADMIVLASPIYYYGIT